MYYIFSIILLSQFLFPSTDDLFKKFRQKQSLEYGCIQGDCKNGWSKFIYGEGEFKGDIYEGEYKNSKRNGYGVYSWAGEWEGQEYRGEWKNWEQHGYGILVYRSGKIESGIWNNNELSKSLSVSQVESYFNNNYSNYYSSKQSLKNGCIDGNCENGKGVNISAYGKFTGEFINNKMYDGILEYKNGAIYEGKFKDGIYKTGWGSYTWPDGNKYIGEFVPWKGRTGDGTFIFSSGLRIEGVFENGSVNEGYNIGIKDDTYYTATWSDGLEHSDKWNNKLSNSLSINELESYFQNLYQELLQSKDSYPKNWSELENVFMTECIRDGFGGDGSYNYCVNGWNCSKKLLTNRWGANFNDIDWEDSDYLDFIDLKCGNQ